MALPNSSAKQVAALQRERDALQAQVNTLRNPSIQEAQRAAAFKEQRTQDLKEGAARGEEIFADGVLGRQEGGVFDSIAKARAEQAQGFTQQEQNALRDQNLTSLASQDANAQRQQQITMAAQGVRGNRASVMQANLGTQQANARAAMERDLFLKNAEAKRTGLDAQQAYETQRTAYNNQQKANEIQGRLTTEMGYGALGAADRGAAVQAVVGQQQAEASKNQGGGGKK